MILRISKHLYENKKFCDSKNFILLIFILKINNPHTLTQKAKNNTHCIVKILTKISYKMYIYNYYI
ncbi:hypothetical protein D9V79_00755 [Buchnera aphidicola (Stegophylla sp.)]|uniref:Uncharacterized protein n=1 Tax=Buchnera aphidicola (Stegophylla sp.) TaxID=2315800 RepID=A0A4D6Y8Q4_9GAMM|nr:hypothetical protein D9V79_00755 [Buchnera aphidicola (Stegophylla sp.)]